VKLEALQASLPAGKPDGVLPLRDAVGWPGSTPWIGASSTPGMRLPQSNVLCAWAAMKPARDEKVRRNVFLVLSLLNA
jgi:hypothetical protein